MTQRVTNITQEYEVLPQPSQSSQWAITSGIRGLVRKPYYFSGYQSCQCSAMKGVTDLMVVKKKEPITLVGYFSVVVIKIP